MKSIVDQYGQLELHVLIKKYQVPIGNHVRFVQEYSEGGRIQSFLNRFSGFRGCHVSMLDPNEGIFFFITVWESERAYEQFELLHHHEFELLINMQSDLYARVDIIDVERLELNVFNHGK